MPALCFDYRATLLVHKTSICQIPFFRFQSKPGNEEKVKSSSEGWEYQLLKSNETLVQHLFANKVEP